MGGCFQFYALAYGFLTPAKVSKQVEDLRNHVYTRHYHHFATLLAGSLRNFSQKINAPLLSLTSLIKQKGLSKGMQGLLYDLGLASPYCTFWRLEKKLLPEYRASLWEKIKGGDPLWFDNFTRIHIHNTVDKGESRYLSIARANLMQTLGTYESLQLTAMGVISSPSTGEFFILGSL